MTLLTIFTHLGCLFGFATNYKPKNKYKLQGKIGTHARLRAK